MKKSIYILFCLFIPLTFYSQIIPSERILTTDELIELLNANDNQSLNEIIKLNKKGKKEDAASALTNYFKENFSDRYYFDWKNFEDRFNTYQELYPEKKASHLSNAEYFSSRYLADTKWQLPFKNQLGDEVTAYRLRHLARQHKAIDMCFRSFYSDTQPETIDYFSKQVKSLNHAFSTGNFELQKKSGGNGIYEPFRAGYRVLNWLLIHNAYLSQPEYTESAQLEMIKALLHHGAQLYKRTSHFKYGNHQTRGLSALALISIMLNEFEGTDAWYRHAMSLLEEHLEKEINPDGFQFERGVHYHISDIDNYFFVYQLAKLNDMEVSPSMENKLHLMFQTIVKIAQPDLNAPVLQDDTDDPWAEFNNISEIMALGAILFEDPEFNYFAGDKLNAFKFWFVRDEQLQELHELGKNKPEIGSTSLENTGYYIMRNGWKKKSEYMIISAGYEERKPSHQHADMLGIVAYADGNEILPNYQVRYFLEDFETFKNSGVKNVAIVDGIYQGNGWKPNSGGSGYGQWESLPIPEVLGWYTGEELDFFSGTHDGYEELGVDYHRAVVFIKDGFWIVRDYFQSENQHDYQQIWQGHYSIEKSNDHLRATFQNGAGLDIIQLNTGADTITFSSNRGKGRAIVHAEDEGNYSFTTLLYPFDGFSGRIEDHTDFTDFSIKDWKIVGEDFEGDKFPWKSDATQVVYSENIWIVLEATYFEMNGNKLKFSEITDFKVAKSEDKWDAQLLGVKDVKVTYSTFPDLQKSDIIYSPGKQMIN